MTRRAANATTVSNADHKKLAGFARTDCGVLQMAGISPPGVLDWREARRTSLPAVVGHFGATRPHTVSGATNHQPFVRHYLGLVCFAAILWATGCTPAGPRALLEGERLLQEGKFTRAIPPLERATQLLPANAQAWNHLGVALHKAGQFDAAQTAYEHARRCDANLTPVRYNLGCLLLEQNNPQAAAAELTTYTLLQRDSAEGWLKLGAAQLRIKQWDAADKSFQNALHLKSDLPEAWNGLGIIQLQHRHTKDAMTSFAAALQKQSNYGPAILNEAVVYHRYLNIHSLALQRYRDYLQVQPASAESASVQENIRELQAELTPPPRREPTNIVSAPAPVQTLVQSNLAARSRPAPTPTAPHFASNVSSNLPMSSGTEHGKSNPVLLAANSSSVPASPTSRTSAEALKRIETPSPPPENPPPTVVQKPSPPAEAILPGPTANGPSAEPVTRKTEIVDVPEAAAPKVAQDSAPPLPGADESGNSGARNSPSPSTPAQSDAASALLAQKLEEPATVHQAPEKRRVVDRLNPANWFRGKKRDSGSPSTIEPLPVDSTSASTRQSDEATAPSSASVRRYAYRLPGKPVAGNRSKADPIFAEAVKAHRDGRLTLAMESYSKAIKLDPSFFEAHYNLGLAAYDSKDTAKSLSAYEAALSINPTSVNARYNFALALEQGGYFEDAALELAKLLEQNPDEARAHLSLASLYAEKLGQPALARPHYRKVLELEPQHPQAPAIRYWLAANP